LKLLLCSNGWLHGFVEFGCEDKWLSGFVIECLGWMDLLSDGILQTFNPISPSTLQLVNPLTPDPINLFNLSNM
ncbi:MAG: hypothetical protein ACKO96_26700, partial [Flammeovirgaceae bacterium]